MSISLCCMAENRYSLCELSINQTDCDQLGFIIFDTNVGKYNFYIMNKNDIEEGFNEEYLVKYCKPIPYKYIEKLFKDRLPHFSELSYGF